MSYDSLFKIYYKNKNSYDNLYNNRINSENTIHFDFFINGEKAFFYYHNDIMKLMHEILLLDKKVDKLFNRLPDQARLQYIKKSLIDEVQYTNEIEGIVSTRKEIKDILIDIENKKKEKEVPSKFYSLVKKYMLLINNEFEPIKTAQDIRKIYDELVLNEIMLFDKNDMPDGLLFRKKNVEVRNEKSGKVVHEGIMPETKIISMMQEAINFLNNDDYELYIRIAIFHYIFSYIHPFYDGNGRTNRYISSLYLKKEYLSLISYRLSLTIKENKTKYYEAFEKTNDPKNKGDMSTFVYEFLDIVKEAYAKTYDYLERKIARLTELKDILYVKKELSEDQRELLWILIQIEVFGGEALSYADLEANLDLSYPTIKNNIEDLKSKGLINFEKQSKRYVFYINIEAFEK